MLDVTPDAVSAGEALRALTARLKAAGVETPGLDARLLLEAATGLPHEALVAAPERVLGSEQVRALADYTARRLAHEPVTRILGRREFWGREFEVTAATLDPRPDSETLIEAALGLVREEGWSARPLRILDIGTGTGCLLLTLLAELPAATGTGLDISAQALAVARRNAGRLGLDARASWLEADIVDRAPNGPFDLVISNPPYLASHEIGGLAPDVRLFDPHLALDGGHDGLDVYRAMIPRLRQGIASGWVIVEVGAGQAGTVAALVRQVAGQAAGDGVRTFVDLGGHARCVAWKTQI